jgi:EAL domain-containing protein (putative c-di-GMP-specific phosphodiesterase class I)
MRKWGSPVVSTEASPRLMNKGLFAEYIYSHEQMTRQRRSGAGNLQTYLFQQPCILFVC